MWLGENDQTFTAAAVSRECQPGVEADVRDFIRRVIKAKKAERVDGKVRLLDRTRATPRLKRDGSINPQWLGPQQMWNVMRREVGGFTAQDVAIGASTDDVHVSENAADQYCKALAAAGKLLVIVEGRRGVRETWRLTGTGNTGPKAPKVMRGRTVYDPNLESIIGDVDVEEVLP